jgi:hypothetical protein
MAAATLRTLHTGTGESMVVERRLVRVRLVLARNFPASMTPALVEAAFNGTATARPPTFE